MAKVMVSARLDGELSGWAKKYAKQRDVSLASIIEAALREFREACEGGVPDIPDGHPAAMARDMFPPAPRDRAVGRPERSEWEKTMRERQKRLNG